MYRDRYNVVCKQCGLQFIRLRQRMGKLSVCLVWEVCLVARLRSLLSLSLLPGLSLLSALSAVAQSNPTRGVWTRGLVPVPVPVCATEPHFSCPRGRARLNCHSAYFLIPPAKYRLSTRYQRFLILYRTCWTCGEHGMMWLCLVDSLHHHGSGRDGQLWRRIEGQSALLPTELHADTVQGWL